MHYFEIQGKEKLKGEIAIPGAKNAALPMMCAALLTSEECIFHNVPNIEDVRLLLEIFEEIGVKVSHDKKKKSVSIQAKNINHEKLRLSEKIKKFRASLLILGPILSRFKECEILIPGGCIIGTRPNFIHMDGFKTLGAENLSTDKNIHLRFSSKNLKNKRLLLSEASVTGTENLSLFLAGKPETSEIYFAAAEPHVCATLRMLSQMGAGIHGIGTHHLTITGNEKLKGGEFIIPPDGILVGTYAIAAILTQGDLLIKNVDHTELYSFYGSLKRTGANFEMQDNELIISPAKKLTALPKIQTAIFPGFPTDLQPPFGVLLTQCEGESLIFETLFENRLTYLYELEKMGAKIKLLDAHQARITGPSQLKGTEVQSWDLRAGAAVVLAGLVAENTTKVTNINYIDRGYENFAENLKNLGAKIKRVE